jgi:hypothetical protein
VEVFPSATPEGGISPLAATGSGGGGRPNIKIVYLRMGIEPENAAWHFDTESIGPFAVINYAGTLLYSVQWSSDDLDIHSPYSKATLVNVKPGTTLNKDRIILTAVSELDDSSYVTNRTFIHKCTKQSFGIAYATGNFSPHLEETATFQLNIYGCPHFHQEGWLEGEIMRLATDGWQHVGWIDMAPDITGHQKRTYVSSLQHTVVWDGIVTEDAALVESPDVFTGPRGSFNRALPEVISEEPVPPPYYTIFFRLRENNHDESEILNEASTRIYVPQIVNLVPFSGMNVFQQPVITEDTNSNDQVVLYQGCTEEEADAALALLPAMVQAFFPDDVNIRIVMKDKVQGRHKGVLIIGETSRGSRRGESVGINKRNAKPSGTMNIFIANFGESLQENFKGMLAGNKDPIPVPMTPEQFAQYIAATIAHEIGHNVGLVDPDYLEAIEVGDQKHHNLLKTRVNMMDMGGLRFVGHRLNPHPTGYWLPNNLRYLRFILPTGEYYE